MNVKLVASTQPLVLTEDGSRYLTPEEFLVYVARVSNPSNQLNTETAPKLIKYLIANKHWSPLEMCDLTFEVKTSRAIAAQILRHKSASFQEFSQRYSEVTESEPVELRRQGKTNRQVGDEIMGVPHLQADVDYHISKAKSLYEQLIREGVAKESARMILPLTVQTTLYFKNNIRNWVHYLDLRCSEHTQKEHRIIANEIKGVFIKNFPNVSKALEWS